MKLAVAIGQSADLDSDLFVSAIQQSSQQLEEAAMNAVAVGGDTAMQQELLNTGSFLVLKEEWMFTGNTAKEVRGVAVLFRVAIRAITGKEIKNDDRQSVTSFLQLSAAGAAFSSTASHLLEVCCNDNLNICKTIPSGKS